MRLDSRLIAAAAFLFAAFLSIAAAGWAARVVEDRSVRGVRLAMVAGGYEWANVSADGLQVNLTGTAPSEAERFRALSAAGSVVDAARVIDELTVTDAAALQAPDFSVEILRNDDGISLIGLVPAATGRDGIVKDVTALAGAGSITDMLETADHPVPAGWQDALSFGMEALKGLPRSKISISPDRVAITAITDSPAQKARLEADLARKAPKRLSLALDISAPHPVIAPFALRFLIDADGARFDVCSADTEKARDAIVTAAVAAGAEGKISCTIGLGVPTPLWSQAVAMSLNGLKEIGAGTLTLSDADISLVAADSVDPAVFDRVVGELESQLPALFSLNAVLTPKPQEGAVPVGVPEFTATLSPEGNVQLRGRLADALTRDAVENFARSRFGNDAVYAATRLDPSLPDGWPIRVLTALEALAELNNGTVTVRPDVVEISGVTGATDARSSVARMLAAKLGESGTYQISIRYDEKLDPLLGLPTAEECVADINAVLTRAKINFDPGSANITAEGKAPLDEIAALMKKCSDFPIEIGGHTDSQGREEMNQALSQERAQAIITALMARRVLTSNLVAKGYGEAEPIADNGTEAGREANRRIELRLLQSTTAAGASTAGILDAGTPAAAGADATIVVEEATDTTARPRKNPNRTDNADAAATDGGDVAPPDPTLPDGGIDAGSGDGDPNAPVE
jgi:OOP family OmpA-OmpF porin